jgi:flavin-binding protein dodecin
VVRHGLAGAGPTRVPAMRQRWNEHAEKRRKTMAVARITEISSSSPKSFEDAVSSGIARSAKTLRNIEGAWVKEMKVVVSNGKITEYRVNMKVTFILE